MLLSILEVPTMLRILTGDSQKLSFSTLTKVPLWIFYQTNPLNDLLSKLSKIKEVRQAEFVRRGVLDMVLS